MSGASSWSIQEFDTHLTHLRGLESAVGEQQAAGLEVPDPLMYGLICSPILVPPFAAITLGGTAFVAGLGHAVGTVTEQFEIMRDAYEQTDQDNADRSDEIDAALDAMEV